MYGQGFVRIWNWMFSMFRAHQLSMCEKQSVEVEKHLNDSTCSCVQRWQRHLYSMTTQALGLVCGVTGYHTPAIVTLMQVKAPKLLVAYLQHKISHCVRVGLIHRPSAPAGFQRRCCSLGHLLPQRWWEGRTPRCPPGLLWQMDECDHVYFKFTVKQLKCLEWWLLLLAPWTEKTSTFGEDAQHFLVATETAEKDDI